MQVLSDQHMHKHTFSNTHTCICEQQRPAYWRVSLGSAPQEPRRSVITYVLPSRQPPAGLHSALLVLTWPDTLAAHGGSSGSQGKSTTIVVAANWLCVEPWVTARSAMADTFFPLVSEKALLSLLLRPQQATEPHMPSHVGPTGPVSPSDGGPHPTHSCETGLASGGQLPQECGMRKSPTPDIYA
jgi:hypothetical protein